MLLLFIYLEKVIVILLDALIDHYFEYFVFYLDIIELFDQTALNTDRFLSSVSSMIKTSKQTNIAFKTSPNVLRLCTCMLKN